jgi:hypothetical protein
MDASLNIVDLIENNPITRLSQTYQHKLLTKIKANFSENEQQLFLASFYCYLKHDTHQDFVIDLDEVWEWLGFKQKVNAKTLLEKSFENEKDYKKSLLLQQKQTISIKGGHNKEIIMLNVDTFKRFCLKAGTKKADEIHDYYLKLESTLHEVLQEESQELQLQLEQKNTALQQQLQQQVLLSEKEKEKLREKTILEQFPKNTQCVYYGLIDNVGPNQEQLVKFGNSNDLRVRVRAHKDTYLNFRLLNAFKVDNKLQIENAIKAHPVLAARIRSLTLNYKKYLELLHLEGLPLPELDKLFREIITDLEFSPTNYTKILAENKALKKQINEIQLANHTHEVILLKTDNERLTLENQKLIKKYNTLKARTNAPEQPLLDNYTVPPPPIAAAPVQSGQVLSAFKKNMKNKDGVYLIDGHTYLKNEGTRQEVWDGIAYQTSGSLLKHDLLQNKDGKLISKKKCILAAIQNHLEDYNATR